MRLLLLFLVGISLTKLTTCETIGSKEPFSAFKNTEYQEKPAGYYIENIPGQSEIKETTNGTQHTQTKQGKFFSFLTLIRFRPFPCNGSGSNTNEQGICITSVGCSKQSGSEIGTCAKGWGVCCQLSTSTCGSTVSDNCTYIQNPNYPSSESGGQSCCYTINKCTTNICMLRLDMIKNTIANQDVTSGDRNTMGDCLVDSMTTTCSTRTNMPSTFCGVNDGQHVYLDIQTVSSCEICFTLGSGSANERAWRIKVSQIPCDASYAPPSGCLQYYTGTTGTICNLGYQDTTAITHLADQAYTMCIRTELNKCSITYSRSTSVTNSWRLSPPTDQAGVGDNCNADYVIIPVSTSPSSTSGSSIKFCGQQFSGTDLSTTSEAITSSQKPFRLDFFTNSLEGATDQNGFCLDYVQNDC